MEATDIAASLLPSRCVLSSGILGPQECADYGRCRRAGMAEGMGNSMNAIKSYITVWVAGLIAGVIIMERWRRTGLRLIPTTAREGDVEPASASGGSTVPAKPPKVSATLVLGAKADAARVRYFVQRVTPWTPNPSHVELRGWSRGATPASTPDLPA